MSRWYCPEHEVYLHTPRCTLCGLAQATYRARRAERRRKSRPTR